MEEKLKEAKERLAFQAELSERYCSKPRENYGTLRFMEGFGLGCYYALELLKKLEEEM